MKLKLDYFCTKLKILELKKIIQLYWAYIYFTITFYTNKIVLSKHSRP